MHGSLTQLAQAQQLLTIEESRRAHGESALTDLLEAQSRYEADLSEVLEAKQRTLVAFITLHKALGGELSASQADSGGAPAAGDPNANT